MTLRTCPGTDCERASQCQRARDHNRNPVAERFPFAPVTTSTRVVWSDSRRAEVIEQACGHFVQWVQQ